MSDGDISFQSLDIILGKYILNQPISLLGVELSVVSDDSCRVLTSVLNGQ
jgi:hypothetical protein